MFETCSCRAFLACTLGVYIRLWRSENILKSTAA
jgi:hypothetical protein